MKKIMYMWIVCFSFAATTAMAGLQENRIKENTNKEIESSVKYWNKELGLSTQAEIDWASLGSFCSTEQFMCNASYWDGQVRYVYEVLQRIASDDVGKKAIKSIQKVVVYECGSDEYFDVKLEKGILKVGRGYKAKKYEKSTIPGKGDAKNYLKGLIEAKL